MEILIFLAALLSVMLFNYIHDHYKVINTPKNKHACALPYQNELTIKTEWKCRVCKAYWYVKNDKTGSYYVKRN